MPEALQVSSDVYFYTLGAEPGRGQRRLPIQDWARSSGSGRRPASTSPARARACCRLPSGATSSTSTQTSPTRPRWDGLAIGSRPTGRGLSATASTSRSARATSGRRRCRWRSPTPRSPTAATSCGPTSAWQVENALGERPRRRSTRRRSARSRSPRSDRQAIMRGLHAAAMDAGRHLVRGLRRLPGRRSPARPAPRSASDSRTSPGTSHSRPYRRPRVRRRRDDRAAAASAPRPRRPPPARSSRPTTAPRAPVARRPEEVPRRLLLRSERRCGERLRMMRLGPPQPRPLRRAQRRPDASARGLLRLDPLLAVRRHRADRLRPLHAGAVTTRRHCRRALLLRDSPGDLRGDRDRADVRAGPRRLLALPRAPRRHLRGDDLLDHPGAASGPGDARLAAMDRASLLHVPAVRAGQGAADRSPWPAS